MSNLLKVIVSTFLLFVFCGSCGKEPEPTSINGVYVAGYEYNAQGKRVAKYWKDGVPTNLSNGATNAEANSIYCTDKEVVVAGFETNTSGKKVAVVWKNGVATNLTDGSTNAVAKSIYVASQVFVMVAGEENGQARLWQNGEVQTLEAGQGSSANAVFVDVSNNSNTYVAGYEKSSSTSAKEVATYWKNGKSVRLTDGSIDCSANSIFVSGNDVYVAGNLGPFGLMYANVWKNGISNPISEYAGSSTSEALSLYGNPGTNEIWVAGAYYDDGIFCCGETHPAIWLSEGNGPATKLGDDLGLPNTKLGTAIFYPQKGQQYVAGNIYNANQKSIAVYWHNLIMTKLTDGSQSAQAKSIFVKI